MKLDIITPLPEGQWKLCAPKDTLCRSRAAIDLLIVNQSGIKSCTFAPLSKICTFTDEVTSDDRMTSITLLNLSSDSLSHADKGDGKPSDMEQFGFAMGPNLATISVIFLLFSIIGTVAVLPNGLCSAENVTCEIANDNLVGIVDGASNATECRDISENGYYTYFGPSGFPFTNSCLFFSSCEKLDQCSDCFTEETSCKFCNAAVEGNLGSNLISVIDDVSDEGHCDESCQLEEQGRYSVMS